MCLFPTISSPDIHLNIFKTFNIQEMNGHDGEDNELIYKDLQVLLRF